MSKKIKVGSVKGINKDIMWKALFVFLLVTTCAGFFWATTQTNYIWHWSRLPKYFYFTDTVSVTSEIEGEVTSVSFAKGETAVVVKSGDQTEHYTFPGNDIRVNEGSTVYLGDVVGVYQEGKIGLLTEGLIITIEVSIVSIILGILLGLFTGLARISSNPCIKWTAITYIEIIRGTPLLVQIMIWYFVLGTIINNLLIKIGLFTIPELWFGVASLAIFAGAYVAEIVRAGIQSIDKGQMEAARSLGMTTPLAMRKIILPQAFKRILPPLAGQFISLIKDSSLLGVIAIRELTKATREAVTTSLMPYELWFLCGVMYLVITFALSMFVQYLEKRTEA